MNTDRKEKIVRIAALTSFVGCSACISVGIPIIGYLFDRETKRENDQITQIIEGTSTALSLTHEANEEDFSRNLTQIENNYQATITAIQGEQVSTPTPTITPSKP